MSTQITKKHIGRRMLVTDGYTGVSCDEVTLLEIAPSGKRAKFRNDHAEYWDDIDHFGTRLQELLPSVANPHSPA